MTKHHTLIGISLLLGTLLVSGCSVKEAQLSKEATNKTELLKQQKALDSAKDFSDKNAKIATDISNTEAKISILDKKINETPLGTDRAKLVQSKAQLEQKILSLQDKQIENAKAFRISKQQ